MPQSSVLNSISGALTTNAAIVRAGRNGAIAVMGPYATDLVIDIDRALGEKQGDPAADQG
jgi:dihydrodipicolinate synthase/N-acetylneuraminate lyase